MMNEDVEKLEEDEKSRIYREFLRKLRAAHDSGKTYQLPDCDKSKPRTYAQIALDENNSGEGMFAGNSEAAQKSKKHNIQDAIQMDVFSRMAENTYNPYDEAAKFWVRVALVGIVIVGIWLAVSVFI